jgi:DNA polymerase-3 subunit gamma/tau
VPLTIQSRSQVFELKALPFSSIREQLRGVTAREGVNIDEGALALVARAAEGSMRDALSALDQVLAFTSQDVTAVDVSTVLGLVGRDVQFDVAEAVAREEASAVFTLAGSIVEAGFDLRTVCRELARLMRDLMVLRIDPARLADPEIASEGERPRMQALAAHYSHEDLMRAFDLLSMAERDIRLSSQPRHTFEMALLKWIHLRKLTPIEELIAGGGPRSATPSSPAPTSPRPHVPTSPRSASAPVPSALIGATADKAELRRDKPESSPSAQPNVKAALLTSIRESNKSFFGMVIAQAQLVEVEGDRIIITFAPAHKNLRPQLEGKKAWIESLAHSLTGRKMSVVIQESAPAPAPAPKAVPASEPGRQADLRARARAEPVVQNVLDVFGGEIEDVEET